MHCSSKAITWTYQQAPLGPYFTLVSRSAKVYVKVSSEYDGFANALTSRIAQALHVCAKLHMPRSVLEAHAFLTRLTDRERRDRAAAASMRQGAAPIPAPSPWVGPVRSLRLGLRCREAGSPQPVERVLWGGALMAVMHADGAVGVEPRCGPVLVKHMQPTDHGFQRRELDNSGERRLEQYRESEEAWLRQRRAASKSRAAAARQQARAALSSLRDEKAFTKRWREWRALERREYDVEDALSEEVSRIRGQRHAYENASWHRIQAFRRQVMGEPTERPAASAHACRGLRGTVHVFPEELT